MFSRAVPNMYVCMLTILAMTAWTLWWWTTHRTLPPDEQVDRTIDFAHDTLVEKKS